MGGREARILGLAFAAMFSMSYAALYPMLTSNFVIYWRPAWPAPLALFYILGGILLQAWFCYRRRTAVSGNGLVAQLLTGVGYFLAACAFGGPYMS